MRYLDCGQTVLDERGNISPALLPDGLNPNPAGYEALFSKCWRAPLSALLDAKR